MGGAFNTSRWLCISHGIHHLPRDVGIPDLEGMGAMRTKFPLRRGFRPDPIETAKHKFLDRRSYCGRRKDGTYHFILFGADKTDVCLSVIERDNNKCQKCGGLVKISGAVHHRSSGDVHRCDCKDNQELQHDACHRGGHPRVGGRLWKQPAFTCPGFVPKEST